VSSATSFDDELSKWHKQLQTIEAVLITWLKVQQLWVQLEEVSTSEILSLLSNYFKRCGTNLIGVALCC